MSDNILVALRLRPFISRELNDISENYWKAQEKCIIQLDPSTKKPVNSFGFDEVFDENITNKDIYECLAHPIVQSGLAGFNGTIFAYGQTSSGKTYTMTGSTTNLGIIPLAIKNLFNFIENMPDREFLLRASYMEIYQENIYDLLTGGKISTVREDPQGQVIVPGLKEVCVINEEMLLAVMSNGDKRRKVGETNMNERSSRSHSIFRLIIESKERGDKDCQGAITVSHLNLVDLAGSENASQTGAVGERLKEGGAINKSLFMLGRVISQLSDGEQHVNFRDSKLTRILQNSLGGNAKTVIICTVTPANREQTLSTVRFASYAKSIKNKPVVNEVLSESALLKRYALEIKKLKHALENERNTDKAQEMEQVKEKLDEQEKKNMELNEKIKALKEKLVVSSHPQVSSDFTDLKKRRKTWSAPAFRKSLRTSVGLCGSFGTLKGEFGPLTHLGSGDSCQTFLKPNSFIDQSSLSSIVEEDSPLHLKSEQGINISTCSFEEDTEMKEEILNQNEKSEIMDDSFLSPKLFAPKRRKKKVRFSTLNSSKPLVETACQTDNIPTNVDLYLNKTPPKEVCGTPTLGQTPREVLRARINNLTVVLGEKDLNLEAKETVLNEWQMKLKELEQFHRDELKVITESCRYPLELEEEITSLRRTMKDTEGLYLESNKRVSEQVQEIKDLKDQVNSLTLERDSLRKDFEDKQKYLDEIHILKKELNVKNAEIKKFENERLDYDMKIELAVQKQKETESYLRKSLDDAWEELAQYEKCSITQIRDRKSKFRDLEKELKKKEEQIDTLILEKDHLNKELESAKEEVKIAREEIKKLVDTTMYTCEDWSPLEQTCSMNISKLNQSQVSRKLSETIHYLDESLSNGLISTESNLFEVGAIKEQLCKLNEMLTSQECFQWMNPQEMLGLGSKQQFSCEEVEIYTEYVKDIEKLLLLESISEDFVEYTFSHNTYSIASDRISTSGMSMNLEEPSSGGLSLTPTNNIWKYEGAEFSFCDDSMTLSVCNQSVEGGNGINLADELKLASINRTAVENETLNPYAFKKEEEDESMQQVCSDIDSVVIEKKTYENCYQCKEREEILINMKNEVILLKEISESLKADVEVLHAREKELEKEINMKDGKQKDIENELNLLKKKEEELLEDLRKRDNDLKNLELKMKEIVKQHSIKVSEIEVREEEFLNQIKKLKDNESELESELNELRGKEEEVESMIFDFLEKEKSFEEKEKDLNKQIQRLENDLIEKSQIISNFNHENELKILRSHQSCSGIIEAKENEKDTSKLASTDSAELVKDEIYLEKKYLQKENELSNKIKELERGLFEKSRIISNFDSKLSDYEKELEILRSEKSSLISAEEKASDVSRSLELEVSRLSEELMKIEKLLEDKKNELSNKIKELEDILVEKSHTINNLYSKVAYYEKRLGICGSQESSLLNMSEKEFCNSMTEASTSNRMELEVCKVTEEKECLQKEVEFFKDIISSLELESSTKDAELESTKIELNSARKNLKDLNSHKSSLELDVRKLTEDLLNKEKLFEDKKNDLNNKIKNLEDKLVEKSHTIDDLYSKVADNELKLGVCRSQESSLPNVEEKENCRDDKMELELRKITIEKECLQKEIEFFKDIISSLELESSTKDAELESTKMELKSARKKLKDLDSLQNSLNEEMKQRGLLIETLQQDIINLKKIEGKTSESWVSIDRNESLSMTKVGAIKSFNEESNDEICKNNLVAHFDSNEVECGKTSAIEKNSSVDDLNTQHKNDINCSDLSTDALKVPDKDSSIENNDNKNFEELEKEFKEVVSLLKVKQEEIESLKIKVKEMEEKKKENSDFVDYEKELSKEIQEKICIELNQEIQSLKEALMKLKNENDGNCETVKRVNTLLHSFNLPDLDALEKVLNIALSLSNDMNIEPLIIESMNVKCSQTFDHDNSEQLSCSLDIKAAQDSEVYEAVNVSVNEADTYKFKELRESESLLGTFEDSGTYVRKDLELVSKSVESNIEIIVPNKPELGEFKENISERSFSKSKNALEIAEDTKHKRIVNLEEDLNIRRKKVDFILAHIKDCKRKMQSLEQYNETLKSELKNNEDRIDSLLKEIDHIKELNTKTSEEESRLLTEIKAKQEVCEDKDCQIKKLSDYIMDLETKLEDKHKESLILYGKVERIEIILRAYDLKDIDSMEKALSENSSLITKASEMDQERITLKEEIASLRKSHERVGDLSAELDELKKAYDLKVAELDELKKAYDLRVRDESTMTKKIEEKLNIITEMDQERITLKEEIATLRKGHEREGDLSAELDELKKAYDLKVRDESTMTKTIEEKLNIITEMNQECITLKEEIASLRKSHERVADLSAELDELKKAYDMKVRDESTLIKKIEEKLNIITEMDQEHITLKEEIASLRKSHEKVSDLSAELDELKKAYDLKVAELDELEKAYDLKVRDESTMIKKIEEKLNIITEMDQEHITLKEEIASLRKSHEREGDLSAELGELKKAYDLKVAELDELTKAYDLKVRDESTMTKKIEEKLNIITEKDNEIKVYNETIDSLKTNNEEMSKENETLNQILDNYKKVLLSYNIKDISNLELKLSEINFLTDNHREKDEKNRILKAMLCKYDEILASYKLNGLEDLIIELNRVNSLMSISKEKDEEINIINTKLIEYENVLKTYNFDSVSDLEVKLKKSKGFSQEFWNTNDECEALKGQVKNCIAKEQKLNLEVEELKKEKEIFIIKEEALRKEIGNKDILMKKNESHIEKLEQMVKCLQMGKENDPNNEKLNKLTKILDDCGISDIMHLEQILTDAKAMSEELSIKRQECDDFKHDIDILTADQAILLGRLQELQVALEEHENVLKEKDETIKSVETDLEDLRKVHEGCTEKGVKHIVEIEKYVSIIEKYEFEMSEKEEKNLQIQKENENLKVDIHNLNLKIKCYQDSETEFIDEINRLKEELKCSSEKLKMLEVDFDWVNKEYKKMKESKSEVVGENSEMTELNAKLHSLQNEKIDLSSTVEKLKTELNGEKKKSKDLEDEIEDLDKYYKYKIKMCNTTLKNLTDRNKTLDDSLKSCKKLHTTSSENVSVDVTSESNSEELLNLKSENEKLLESLSRVQKENESLKKQERKETQEERVNEAHNKEEKSLREQIFNLKKDNNVLKIQIQALQAPVKTEAQKWKEALKLEQEKNKKLFSELRRIRNDNAETSIVAGSAGTTKGTRRNAQQAGFGSGIVLDVQVMDLKNENYHLEKEKENLKKENNILKEQVEWYKSKGTEWKTKFYKEFKKTQKSDVCDGSHDIVTPAANKKTKKEEVEQQPIREEDATSQKQTNKSPETKQTSSQRFSQASSQSFILQESTQKSQASTGEINKFNRKDNRKNVSGKENKKGETLHSTNSEDCQVQ